jgi:predicted MFS family arabinose efflux permease
MLRLATRRAREADSALRGRPFRALWLGQSASALGDAFVPLASVFAVLRIGGSARTIGLLLMTGIATRICALLVGGVMADRISRVKTMVIADLVRAATQASVAIALVTRYGGPAPLFAGAVIYYAASGVFIPACGRLVRELVPAETVQRANGLLESSNQSCLIAGQMTAGLLVAATGPGPAFAIDAASFAVSAVCVSLIPPADSPVGRSSRFWRDFRAGWIEIGRRGWYLFNLIMHAMWNLGAAVFFVLGPVMMGRYYGGSAAWGVTLTSISAGSVAGGLATARIRARRTVMIANSAGLLVAALLLLLAARAPLYTLAIGGAVAYAGAGLLDGVWRSMVQQLIPVEILSRATASNWIISLIAVPVGYGLAGPAATTFGVAPTLAGGAGIAAMASILLVVWAWRAGATRLDSGIFTLRSTSRR